MVGDMKPFAERQKHLRSHNTVGGRAKNIGEDALTLAKSQKHWRRHEAVCGETKPIGEALPTMVGDDVYLIE